MIAPLPDLDVIDELRRAANERSAADQQRKTAARAKLHGLIVSTARGERVDTNAVLRALDDGGLELSVFEQAVSLHRQRGGREAVIADEARRREAYADAQAHTVQVEADFNARLQVLYTEANEKITAARLAERDAAAALMDVTHAHGRIAELDRALAQLLSPDQIREREHEYQQATSGNVDCRDQEAVYHATFGNR